MTTIHNVVKHSAGAYTHDDVFELEAGFVKHLELMWYEEAMYQQRRSIERDKMKSND